MKNFGSVMEAARAKANEAMEAAKAVQQRVAEAAGAVDKAEDDPDIQQHFDREALLRRLAKHSDGYVKAMRAMCDAVQTISEDFLEATEAFPELQESASQFAAATDLSRQMAVVGQAINQLVAAPVNAELEGRKEIERRLNERKKVRADYEAYKKKQMGLINTDPSNRQVYNANLEAAHKTFAKHSESVVREVRGVNRERTNRACSSLLAVIASHSAFMQTASSSLENVNNSLTTVFEKVPAMGKTYQQVQSEIRKQPLAVARPPPVPPPAMADNSASTSPPMRAPPARSAATSSPVPPAAAPAAQSREPSLVEDSSGFDPFGIHEESKPLASLATAPSVEDDLLSGFASPPTPPTSVADLTEDLLSGFGPPTISGPGSRVSSELDIMNMGLGAMDDLSALSAPPALSPETVPQPRMRAAPQKAATGNTLDDLFMTGGPVAAPSSEPNLMMGGDPFGIGAMSAPDPFGDANEPEARRRLRAQKEAAKNAAIADKVNALKAKEAQAESNREAERELEKSLKLKVAAWQREKKNLRALLASLHEIAPPCSWKPMSLGELLDPSAVKKAYRKAILVVHPDKQDNQSDLSAKVLAQLVFDALRDAWEAFEKTG